MNRRLPLFAFVVLAVASAPAHARRRSFSGGSSSYTSNGTFGLGIELGSPSGLNGKYFLTPSTALNFGVGYIYDRYWYDDRDGLHLYLDHLWHPAQLTQNSTFKLPFFIGIGGRLWAFDHRDDNAFAVGLRVPFGIAFDFNNVPLDIFVQLTVVGDLLLRHDDRVGLHLEGSVGIRYWFD